MPKSCKLYIRNEGFHNEHFEVTVTESIAVDNAVKSKQLDRFTSKDINKIGSFLSKYDVSKLDLSEALTIMDEYGYNVANFGFMGGFVFGTYEGVVH
jgi:hypothetical protein